jgi:DNA-binding NtrC family response regulator
VASSQHLGQERGIDVSSNTTRRLFSLLAQIKLVVCSDDRKLCPLVVAALGKEIKVTAESGQAAKEMASEGQCDVVLLDLDSERHKIDEMVRLYEEIARFEVPILIIASDQESSTTSGLLQRRAFGYLTKRSRGELNGAELNPTELKTMIRRAHASRTRSRSQDTQLKQPFRCGNLMGASAPMLAVYDLIQRVADLDVSVLITGESGTGKELVARAIHGMGRRAGRPFVAVSCGAFPETLIEAELFGHEKGAFTGTTGLREGYLEKTSNGTLFLDEIGELSLPTQVKMLRVIQEREFSRLGSIKAIPLQARLLFATHRDLGQMVAAGSFRQDLFYRINVLNINVPALQEHQEDISLLALHFVHHYSETFRLPVSAIDQEAVRALERYPWPGNIRELENVIQRAIVMAKSDHITLSDLPEEFQDASELEFEGDQGNGTFETQVKDYRIKLALEAIRGCNGNKTMAAQRLSISRAYLHRLLRQFPNSRLPVALTSAPINNSIL